MLTESACLYPASSQELFLHPLGGSEPQEETFPRLTWGTHPSSFWSSDWASHPVTHRYTAHEVALHMQGCGDIPAGSTQLFKRLWFSEVESSGELGGMSESPFSWECTGERGGGWKTQLKHRLKKRPIGTPIWKLLHSYYFCIPCGLRKLPWL